MARSALCTVLTDACSTSYVFSGHNVPPGGYTPAHSPDPLLTYGEQKALAEKAALSSGPVGKTFVLRIPLLYSLDRDAPKHWLSELLRQVEAGEPIRVDDREFHYPVEKCISASLSQEHRGGRLAFRMLAGFYWTLLPEVNR